MHVCVKNTSPADAAFLCCAASYKGLLDNFFRQMQFQTQQLFLHCLAMSLVVNAVCCKVCIDYEVL